MNSAFSLRLLVLLDLTFVGFLLIALIFSPGKRIVPYLWRSLLASNIGILIANSLFWVVSWEQYGLLRAIIEAEPSQGLTGVLLAISILASPRYVAVIGALSGIVFGILWARRSLRLK